MATLDVLRLLGGLIYLVLGGDLLVRGALGLARRTAVSPVVIGLTIVALGTSAPELVISVYAGLTGFAGVALGNVVGSNIANVLLVLGAPALISPILVDAKGGRAQAAVMLVVTGVFIALLANGLLSRLEGIALLGALLVALIVVYRLEIDVPGAESPDETHQLERVLGLPSGLAGALGFVLLGAVLLPVGADLTVEGAVAIAGALGIPEAVIGSTVVALGTSLPELSTTVIAAFHRSSDIAIGNVIGSNILNILLVAGAAASLAPLAVPETLMRFDVWVMLACAVALFGFVLAGRPIGRLTGAVFALAYVSYVVAVM